MKRLYLSRIGQKFPRLIYLFVHGQRVQQLNQFSYLGSSITSDCKSGHEIKRIIGMAKLLFRK